MQLTAVVFDLDNTLHDKSATLALIAARDHAWARLDHLGIAAADWSHRYHELNQLKLDKAEVFARLGEDFSLPQPLTQALFTRFEQDFGATAQAFAGALELVTACKARGWKTGLVTNGRDGFQRAKLTGMGLTDQLDTVLTSGGFGLKKPDLRIFQACCQQLGVAPEQTAFVGDNFEADMQPALTLGMLAIWKSEMASTQVAFSSNRLSEIQAFLLSR